MTPRRAANRHTITLPIVGAMIGSALVAIASCAVGASTVSPTPAPTRTVTDPPHMATRIEKVPTTPISCRKALDLADRAHKITDGPMDARAAEQLAEVLADYRNHRDQCRETP